MLDVMCNLHIAYLRTGSYMYKYFYILRLILERSCFSSQTGSKSHMASFHMMV